jgi:hypothetical protein
MHTCFHTHTTQTAHSGRPHGHTCMITHVIPGYMLGATSSVCARSHLTRTQLAMHTLPAITHMSHMHSKPSATCQYSQLSKQREALEHVRRQRRDLVAAEMPAQAHTHLQPSIRIISNNEYIHTHAHTHQYTHS